MVRDQYENETTLDALRAHSVYLFVYRRAITPTRATHRAYIERLRLERLHLKSATNGGKRHRGILKKNSKTQLPFELDIS